MRRMKNGRNEGIGVLKCTARGGELEKCSEQQVGGGVMDLHLRVPLVLRGR